LHNTNDCAVAVGNSGETCNDVQDAHSDVDEVQPHSTKDTAPERPPYIEIVPDATVGAMDADEEVSVISARMSQLDLGLPMISVQIASPVAMSPTEKEGTLCSAMEKYANAWTGNFDIDEACDQAGRNSEIDADGNKKSDVSCEQGHQDVEMCDVEDRPLSPTDYTLEDESDLNQSDARDAYHPMLLGCRAPSPSEFSLMTESAEENELHRLTYTAVPDDVFAIPDPSPSSAEMNMYLAMQYDQFACSRHPDDTNHSAVMPGTNI